MSTSMRTWTGFVSIVLPVLLLGPVSAPPSGAGAPVRAVPNDNRRLAGVRHGGTLVLRPVVQRAEWYPEADSGPHITIEAFQRPQPSVQAVAVEQTFAFDSTSAAGIYELRAEVIPPPDIPAPGPLGRWRQRLVVR